MIFIKIKTSPFRLPFRRAFRYADFESRKAALHEWPWLVDHEGRNHWEGAGGGGACGGAPAPAGAAGSRSNVITPSVAESTRSKRFGLAGLIVVVYLFPFISWIATFPPCTTWYLPVTGAGPFVSGAAGAALSSAELSVTVILTVLSARKTR